MVSAHFLDLCQAALNRGLLIVRDIEHSADADRICGVPICRLSAYFIGPYGLSRPVAQQALLRLRSLFSGVCLSLPARKAAKMSAILPVKRLPSARIAPMPVDSAYSSLVSVPVRMLRSGNASTNSLYSGMSSWNP